MPDKQFSPAQFLCNFVEGLRPERIEAGKMLPQNLKEKIAKWGRETEEAT